MKFFLDEEARGRQVKPLIAPRPGDAGYDLRSKEDITISPGEQARVHTGLHLALPSGWVGLIRDRSSVAAKRVYVHSGVVDSSYRGEVLVVLENAGHDPVRIRINDKIAQMLVIPHYSCAPEPAAELGELGRTARGAGGFGSTGIQ